MDTKLKKSKYNPFIKFTAILLTVLFAFLTGINALNALRKGIYYANNNNEYSSTLAFSEAIKSALYDIYDIKHATAYTLDSVNSYSEFLETDTAKDIQKSYKEKEEQALKLYNTIQKLKSLKPYEETTEDYISGRVKYWYNDSSEFDVCYYYDEMFDYYVSDYFLEEYLNEFYPDDEYLLQRYYADSEYDYDYAGTNSVDTNDYGSPDTTAVVTNYVTSVPADEELFSLKENYTTLEEWNEKYQQLRTALFMIVDVAKSEDGIKEELNNKCENKLSSTYWDYEETQSTLNEFVNIDFILTENKTGNTISSIAAKDREEFIKNLKNDSLFYIAFDGSVLKSPASKSCEATNFLKIAKELVFTNSDIDEFQIKNLFDGYTLYLKLNKDVVQGDIFYNSVNTFNELNDTEEASSALGLAVFFAILSVAALVGICVMSGKRADGSIKLAPTDKIPFVLHLIATLALLFLCGAAVAGLVISDVTPDTFGNSRLFLWLTTNRVIRNLTGLAFTLFSLFLTSFILYIARNKKAGTLGNRFIIGFIISKIKKSLKRLGDYPQTVKNIRKRTFIILAGYVIINLIILIFLIAGFKIIAIPALIVFNALALVYVVLYLSDVLRLAGIAEQIKEGTFDTVINASTFIKPLRKFALDLSVCQSSIKTAVDNAIKGEQMKTELITNVSHDLKTPLTSIINYVSLLKMCEIESEDARGYIDILDNKSKKLKRLIEDLTEASKATSGNIKMNLETVALNEMALQAVGENSDTLENAGLDLILTEKDTDIFVKADSQHTFRVIDNLFSNAKKYSLAGTRVYVDVYKENAYGVFSIKNISREKLNINPNELTERFVRGDNSRSTDGSGLGLSIARSFTELQGGSFEVTIDGDMFKAAVKLPLTENPDTANVTTDTAEEPEKAYNNLNM